MSERVGVVISIHQHECVGVSNDKWLSTIPHIFR